MLMTRITAVNDRIDLSMSDFHQTTKDINGMIRQQRAKPDGAAIFGADRHKRQTGQCRTCSHLFATFIFAQNVMERTGVQRVQPASRAMPVPTVSPARQARRVWLVCAVMLRR
jgi:hypothetical protein